jgi:ankyrin repeat protein
MVDVKGYNIFKALDKDNPQDIELLTQIEEGMNYIFPPGDAYLPDDLLYGSPLINVTTYCGAGKCIEYMMTQGIELAVNDLLGRTCIHTAALAGRMEMLQVEHFHGLDYNAKDWQGRTPLHLAVIAGRTEVVAYLIDHEGGDVNACDRMGHNSVLMATETGNLEMIRFLLERGAHVIEDRNGYPPLLIALKRHKLDIYNYFLRASPQAHQWQRNNMNLFHFACAYGVAEAIPDLVPYGDIVATALDQYGWAPIHYAVAHGDTNCVKELLKIQGFEIRTRTGDKDNELTAMFLGIHFGSTQAVKKVFEADRTQKTDLDPNQGTALHVSAKLGQVDLVKYFLDQRIPREALDGDGKKAVTVASGTRKELIRKTILDWVDPDAKKKNKEGCCQVA